MLEINYRRLKEPSSILTEIPQPKRIINHGLVILTITDTFLILIL